jgi:hypothetical protein
MRMAFGMGVARLWCSKHSVPGPPARCEALRRFAKNAGDHTYSHPESEQPRTAVRETGTKVAASSVSAHRLRMEHFAPPPSEEASTNRFDPGATTAPALTEMLRRALAELNASAVGVTRASGGPPRYFTRSAIAARFFEDICSVGLAALKEQTHAKSGVFGANRVKGDEQGPIRGRLIAVSLRNTGGMPVGILIATRLIEEPKFGAQESQKLLALAPEFAVALTPPRAVPVLAAASVQTSMPTTTPPSPRCSTGARSSGRFESRSPPTGCRAA